MYGIPHPNTSAIVATPSRRVDTAGTSVVPSQDHQSATGSQHGDSISSGGRTPYPVENFDVTMHNLERKIVDIQKEVNDLSFSFINDSTARYQIYNTVPSSSYYPIVRIYEPQVENPQADQLFTIHGVEKKKARHVSELMRQYDDLTSLHRDLVAKSHLQNSPIFPKVIEYDSTSERNRYHFDFPVSFQNEVP